MIRDPFQTVGNGGVARLVAALLPPSWPSRDAALTAAAHVDAQRGQHALDVTLHAWASLREFGQQPTDRWLADLLLELQNFIGGGLEPRPGGAR